VYDCERSLADPLVQLVVTHSPRLLRPVEGAAGDPAVELDEVGEGSTPASSIRNRGDLVGDDHDERSVRARRCERSTATNPRSLTRSRERSRARSA
jgi:hypothetical protein